MYRSTLIFAGFLAGCASVVPDTALRLGRMNPLTADPGAISVAVKLSDGLGVLPGSVKLRLSALTADDRTISKDWTLEALEAPDTGWLFRIAEEDLSDVRRTQRQIAAWEKADPEATQGSISVSLGGCRTAFDTDVDEARASVDVRFSKDGPLRPLVRNAPIAEVLGPEQMARLPLCP